jgi:hypothetical protein
VNWIPNCISRGQLQCDGTCAETRFCLLAKQTSPFKLVRASVQSTTGSQGLCISGSNAGYTMLRGGVRVLATHSIYHFPLHFPSCASPFAITFQLESTTNALFCALYTPLICSWNIGYDWDWCEENGHTGEETIKKDILTTGRARNTEDKNK